MHIRTRNSMVPYTQSNLYLAPCSLFKAFYKVTQFKGKQIFSISQTGSTILESQNCFFIRLFIETEYPTSKKLSALNAKKGTVKFAHNFSGLKFHS